MSIKVTAVSFSFAKEMEESKNGSCGFCRVILNGVLTINRVRVIKRDSDYVVQMPVTPCRSVEENALKSVVQITDRETMTEIETAVLKEYNAVLKNTKVYSKKPSRKNSQTKTYK
ncbi:septation protein SpoVG family protein [Bacillus cereus]|uniref:septation protein SpoVG family protein n=1 Tax=Bacillus cereus TaxID=1396 RepID=UPI003D169F81